MKKVLALAIVLLLLLAGCDNTSKTNQKKSGSGKKTSQTESETDTSLSDDEIDDLVGPTTETKAKKSLTYDGLGIDSGNGSGRMGASSFVEKGTSVSTLKTNWEGVYKKSSASDASATKLRNKILSSENTAQKYKITGTTYYVSPDGNDDNDGKSPKTAFQSLDAPIFMTSILKPGDAVLFERGGLWRTTSAIATQHDIIYGAYGTGEKPAFYGSPYNYASEDQWVASNLKNVWKVTVADTDIGLVVFDQGTLVGKKKLNGLISLEKNGDFYFNEKDDTLYLYYDKGNPGKVFKDIEIGFRISCFSVSDGDDNVVLDNIKIKYFGSFAISVRGSDNVKITNCEIGFIGGSRQYPGEEDKTRYGNGIQVWNGVDKNLIEDCWVYQVYDTGITWQGNNYWPETVDQHIYKDVVFRENLIEYCEMQFEFWHGDGEADPASSNAEIDSFILEDNISRFAGYGWGSDTPQPRGAHIQVGNRALYNAHDCVIKNNIFDCSKRYVVNWYFSSYNGDWDITGNTYYQKESTSFGFSNEQIHYEKSNLSASTQSEFEYAISIFDSAPKEIKYLGNW